MKNMVKYIFRRKFDEDSSDEEEKGIRFRHNPINNNLNLNEVNYLATDHYKSL